MFLYDLYGKKNTFGILNKKTLLNIDLEVMFNFTVSDESNKNQLYNIILVGKDLMLLLKMNYKIIVCSY